MKFNIGDILIKKFPLNNYPDINPIKIKIIGCISTLDMNDMYEFIDICDDVYGIMSVGKEKAERDYKLDMSIIRSKKIDLILLNGV